MSGVSGSVDLRVFPALITLDLRVWRERCRDDRDTGRRDQEEAPSRLLEAQLRELVRLAKEQGLSLTGPDGLLSS